MQFVQSWFSTKLPLLSFALGIGAAKRPEIEQTEADCQIPSSDDIDFGTTDLQAGDEVCASDVLMEVQEEVVVGTVELRRSGRERKATRRFEEGWFGVLMPRLSEALGLAVR